MCTAYIAYRRMVTWRWSTLSDLLTIPRLEVAQLVQWRWISHPLEHLPFRGKVDITIAQDLIYESHEALTMMDRIEPRRMIIQSKWRTITIVMSLEVFQQHGIDTILIRWIRASIAHRASTTTKIFPHYHSYR